jgi:hypothetical protein
MLGTIGFIGFLLGFLMVPLAWLDYEFSSRWGMGFGFGGSVRRWLRLAQE